MMTAAIHDSHNIDMQKQRYSRELAAYTMQQWDMARQAVEAGKNQPKEKSSKRSSRSSSVSRDGKSPSSKSSQGIQSIDYARRSQKPSNALAYESRADAVHA